MKITMQVGSTSKVSDLYFGGDRFESRPEQQLSSLMYIGLFPRDPPANFWDNILKLSDNY
jgi:hypothetical protein